LNPRSPPWKGGVLDRARRRGHNWYFLLYQKSLGQSRGISWSPLNQNL